MKRERVFWNKIVLGTVYLVMAMLVNSMTNSGCRVGCSEELEALSSAETNDRVRGEKAAFVAMVEHHGDLLFRVAHALLRHPQDAEDAVQDALLKLYRTGAWKQTTNERAFLARTVWRSALDRYNRRPKAEESFDGHGQSDGLAIASLAATPEVAAVEEENEGRLYAMVEALPLELRAPLMLLAIEDMTTREIAVALGLHEGTVRTRIHRARVELRRRFAAAGLLRKGNVR